MAKRNKAKKFSIELNYFMSETFGYTKEIICRDEFDCLEYVFKYHKFADFIKINPL